jgi:hypothetical protein
MYDKILRVIRQPAVSFRVLSDYVEFHLAYYPNTSDSFRVLSYYVEFHPAYSAITLKLFRILEANFLALTIFKGTLFKKTDCG